MKYMLLFYSNEAAGVPEADQPGIYADWMKVMKEAEAAGILIANNGLAPVSNATTVRVRDNKTLITDGPFAETHEQLGGFFLVECKDLDEAVAWAAKVPTAKYGSIEIRPQWNNA
jgi:hypothetical protein